MIARVPRAEFEEKSYEIAAAIELGAMGHVFSPGQVLEGRLGFDAATAPDPSSSLLWQLLSVPRPRGLLLIPPLWSVGSRPTPGDLPGWPVSLILQYKRPEYMWGARAAQWKLWRRPYFRFRRTGKQQRILKRLEVRVGSGAVVRYAAPAFWRQSELEAAHLSRTVLAQSGFVSPTAMGSHAVWTYTEPGRYGRANPDGPPQHFDTLDELLGAILDPMSREEAPLPVRRQSLEDHIGELGAAARTREPRLRARVNAWRENVRRTEIDIPAEAVALAADIAAVTTLLAGIGATWHLAERGDWF
jgi:hypothetical protein